MRRPRAHDPLPFPGEHSAPVSRAAIGADDELAE
jgi:hypothetical protein